jgi:hypothetical protein
LHPLEDQDRRLLKIIKDLQPLLYPTAEKSPDRGAPSSIERRRRSSAVSRKLRLLRAHHLIRKVPASHSDHVTPAGRQIVAGVIAAFNATVD